MSTDFPPIGTAVRIRLRSQEVNGIVTRSGPESADVTYAANAGALITSTVFAREIEVIAEPPPREWDVNLSIDRRWVNIVGPDARVHVLVSVEDPDEATDLAHAILPLVQRAREDALRSPADTPPGKVVPVS